MESNVQSNQIIPLRGGSNLAPVRPLIQLAGGDKKPSHPIQDALKERFQHYMQMQESVFREIYLVGQLIDLFIQGKQRLRRSPYNNEWVIAPVKNENTWDNQGAINILRFYESNMIAKWDLSNPDVRVAAGINTDEAEQSARGATVIVDHYEERFYDEIFNNRQGKLALRFGTYVYCLRHDPGMKGILALKDIFADKNVRLGDGWAKCGDCLHASKATDFGYPSEGMAEGEVDYSCPKCQSQAVFPEPPAEEIINGFSHSEQVEMGDLSCTEWPLPSVRWDLAKRPEESSWLIHSERTTLSAVRSVLGNIKQLNGETKDVGLDVLDALAGAGMPLGGVSQHGTQKRTHYKDPVTISEFWMSAEDYGDIEIDGDQETLAGIPLPKGKLIDVFPENLCAVMLNGQHLWGLYAESHKSYIVSGTWHMNPLSGAGSGMNDAIEPQKRRNKYDGQNLRYWEASATPAWLYEKNMISSDYANSLDDPKGAIPVNLMSLPPELRGLDKAIKQLPPQSPAAGFTQYTYEHLNNMMQLTTQVTDFSGGLPGVKNDTATGARITAANSNALFTPPFQIKAASRKRAARLTVDLYRQHMPLKRYFPLGGKHGKQQGIMLSGADLCTELLFTVVQNSEYPRNPLVKQENALAMFGIFKGGVAEFDALMQTNPGLAGELAETFGVELRTENYSVVEGLCLKRFKMMQSVADLAQDPMQIMMAIQPPISPFEPSLELKAKWWTELLDDDAGQDAAPQLRAAIELVIQEHIGLSTGQASVLAAAQGMVARAGAQPQMDADQQMADQQRQQGLQDQAAQQGVEAQNAETDRAHEAASAEDAHGREMDKMAFQHASAMQLAKAKPKGKAT